MKNLLSSFAIVLLLVAGMVSCKKDDKPSPVCRISTATISSLSSSSIVSFTYDEAGRITKMVSVGTNNFNKTFTYTGSSITIVQSDTGGIVNTSDVSLNADGLPVTVIKKDKLGTVEATMSFLYSGKELTRLISTYGSSTADTENYVFSNGNLSTLTSGTSVTLLSYYTDKNYKNGDYLKFVQLYNNGYEFILNKNLLKSVTSGGTSTELTYDFDNAGKITRMNAGSGSSGTTVDYTYNCN